MTKIENNKYNVGEAFSQHFFSIPDYQRAYVWEEKQVHELLQDIVDEYEDSSDGEYFIGIVLVSRIQTSASDLSGMLEVIDGQQRLTTLFLMLCALKHLLDGDSRYDLHICRDKHLLDGAVVKRYSLDLRYEGAEDFCRVVSTAPSYSDLKAHLKKEHGNLLGSLGKLANAYENIILFLSQKYSDGDTNLDTEALLKFSGYLMNCVVYTEIRDSVSRALKLFETINDRGVGLDSMDLLKNLLFANVEHEEYGNLKSEWQKIVDPLEKNKKKPLRFLRYYLMANYEGRGAMKDPVIREDRIYDWLTDRANAESCGYRQDPISFIRELADGANTYVNFSAGRDRHGKDNIPLDSLRKLCGSAFSLHFIPLMAASKLPDSLFDYLVRQLESFMFYFIVTKSVTRDLESDLSLWADDLRGIVADDDKASQKQRLFVFVQEKFKRHVDAKAREFEDHFKRLGFDSIQKYRLSYTLAKLTQYVDMRYMGVREPGRLHEYRALEIEHILPDNPESDFRREFEGGNPGYVYDEVKNKIGNLTLLEKPINIVAGRGFFEEKKPLYEKSGNYLTRSISSLASVGKDTSIEEISGLLKSFDKWGAGEIEDRQDMLMRLAKEVWKIE